jgi:hypothetical protein
LVAVPLVPRSVARSAALDTGSLSFEFHGADCHTLTECLLYSATILGQGGSGIGTSRPSFSAWFTAPTAISIECSNGNAVSLGSGVGSGKTIASSVAGSVTKALAASVTTSAVVSGFGVSGGGDGGIGSGTNLLFAMSERSNSLNGEASGGPAGRCWREELDSFYLEVVFLSVLD